MASIAERIATFKGPKSLCKCGHTGDGGLISATSPTPVGSDHGGLVGHGACCVKGCGCKKFSWDTWLPAFEPLSEEFRRAQQSKSGLVQGHARARAVKVLTKKEEADKAALAQKSARRKSAKAKRGARI
jgi:hypothetical protein